jgi:flagellar L-ring protein precursor FlgH
MFTLNKPFSTIVNAIAFALTLTACAMTPTTVTQGPLTAKPAPITPVAANSGAIYNASGYHPLFEDRRPRSIGDILTITIAENTSATKAAGSSGSKKGSTKSSITSLFGHNVPDASFAGSTDNSNEDKDAANASNVFSGSITVTVVDVLANGNLVVSGEKQISLDKGTEFVRLSGVVNPDFVAAGNTISSNKVADARVEYRTNAKVDAALVTSALARFFLSIGAL